MNQKSNNLSSGPSIASSGNEGEPGKLPYRRKVPDVLSAHQMGLVSKDIYMLTSDAIAAHLEDKPHYLAIEKILSSVHLRMRDLERAKNSRRYKSPEEMRQIKDGDSPSRPNLAQRKLTLHRQRALTMSRFRQFVSLFQVTASDTQKETTDHLSDLLNKRIPRFERLCYSESTQEFRHLIKSIEKSPKASIAIERLNLGELYHTLKSEQDEFIELRRAHVSLKAERKAAPKIVPTTKALRHSLGILLTMLHFEVESGDNTLRPLLAHIDEIIDKEVATGKGRKTRKANRASKTAENKVLAASNESTQESKPAAKPAANPTTKTATKAVDGADDQTDRAAADPADISGPPGPPVPANSSDPACLSGPSDLSCPIPKQPDQCAAPRCLTKSSVTRSDGWHYVALLNSVPGGPGAPGFRSGATLIARSVCVQCTGFLVRIVQDRLNDWLDRWLISQAQPHRFRLRRYQCGTSLAVLKSGHLAIQASDKK